MEEIKNEIINSFGNKLRIRVCGFCIEENKILLVKHHSLGETGILWTPPGGGIMYGESAEEALKREFLEETGLTVSIEKFLCVHEYLTPPLHAIELFFLVKKIHGTMVIGQDPELVTNRQIITDVDWISFDTLQTFPPKSLHSILLSIKNTADIKNLIGYSTLTSNF
jgi:8-oxo-dGTP diphosphatase